VPFVEYDEVEAACSECGRLFRSEDALRAHVSESHASEVPAPSAARPVACSVCGRRFPNLAGLAEHNRRTHTN
jgi:uncharacterized Zn-finger protein